MDWLPATELEHAPELVHEFHKSYPTKPDLFKFTLSHNKTKKSFIYLH